MSFTALDPFLRIDPFLREAGMEDSLRNVVFTIAHAGKYVAHTIRNENLDYVNSTNESGDEQLALDVLSDRIFCNHLHSSQSVAKFASEEQEEAVQITCSSKNPYSVAFDPLDGSSIVDADFAIGSIFGIFPGKDFLGKTGRDIVAAGYILYGPKTIFVVATEKGVWEFTENAIGEFVLSRKNIALAEEAQFFAPGNIRAIAEKKQYENLITDFAKSGKSLRYSGGMVPDIHMMLTKGSGIFLYPANKNRPKGKLRLLFECAPFAFLINAAGGMAVDEHGNNLLDKVIIETHQTDTILAGSKKTVEQAVEKLGSEK
ncbi:fructose-1,6-bisphosphatase [Candidatus Peregrinibacteria bacterium]|nr:MAG: fructose-1,6-bisphosphatase [Candidatus Peregrinibacteria bacterium]